MNEERKPFSEKIFHPQPEFRLSEGLTPYETALKGMEERVLGLIEGQMGELVWLLQHPPLYTAGTSAVASDLLEARFPVYDAGRGGQYTYHGPGQRVAYVMLDLNKRGRDLRVYVQTLEEWLIRALARLGVEAGRREGRVGLWVARDDGSGLDDKIAAIGVRVRKWVTFHGIALNVAPDLSHFAGIVPCGIRGHGVTSLHALGKTCTMADVDAALKAAWAEVF